MIDRTALAEFLRHRRESLQPEDVGMLRTGRRRTSGLRREEVADLCHMSTYYYARLEQERGPLPSEQMIASIAQGLHLTMDERDHLFRLAGHHPPVRGADSGYISPGLLRVLDRLSDTPAEIVSELGDTLRQSPLGAALMGDSTRYTGPSRSRGYRWFADLNSRRLYLPEDHAALSQMYAAGLRRILALRGPQSRAARLAELLLQQSEEFADLWQQQNVQARPDELKRLNHPELGYLELDCQRLLDPGQSHALLVYTAIPGSRSYEKLQSLTDLVDQPAG
jgi:transcriptional regulator with XRE-family HTH domain